MKVLMIDELIKSVKFGSEIAQLSQLLGKITNRTV